MMSSGSKEISSSPAINMKKTETDIYERNLNVNTNKKLYQSAAFYPFFLNKLLFYLTQECDKMLKSISDTVTILALNVTLLVSQSTVKWHNVGQMMRTEARLTEYHCPLILGRR